MKNEITKVVNELLYNSPISFVLPILKRIGYMVNSSDRLIGTFQHFEYPSYAIKLKQTDYRYSIGEYGEEGFYEEYYCPACAKPNEQYHEHGDAWKCECGLNRQVYGNSIYVWYDGIFRMSNDIIDMMDDHRFLVPYDPPEQLTHNVPLLTLNEKQ